jgi:hypothetical protein
MQNAVAADRLRLARRIGHTGRIAQAPAIAFAGASETDAVIAIRRGGTSNGTTLPSGLVIRSATTPLLSSGATPSIVVAIPGSIACEGVMRTDTTGVPLPSSCAATCAGISASAITINR